MSANATKHGILSSKAWLPSEDKAQYKALQEQTFLALQPCNEIENILVDRIVATAWRLRRTALIEEGLFEKDPLRFLEPDSLAGTFQNRYDYFSVLSRYETGLERSLYRALHELQRMQALRRGNMAALPVAVDIQVSDTDRHGE